MQLALLDDRRTAVLATTQARLEERFGGWRRTVRRDPVGTLIHGLVGWKTRTELTLAIVDGLEAEFVTWEALRDADLARVFRVIAPVTFAERKAPRLREVLMEVTRRQGRLSLDHLAAPGVPAAIAWLESLPGVGRKIAAEVLNASTLNRLALVIDGHHHRVVRRLGLVRHTATVLEVYYTLMPLLPPAWGPDDLDAHHMLVKRLGQTVCRHDVPHCDECPLRSICRTGSAPLEAARRPVA